ncbi:unnamed protein product, partial [Tetraodon nigroviridis]
MPKVSGGAPTASGQEWKFYCSVGVDCSDAEPRCIWMAVLRCLSPSASPRRIPITSTQHRGCQRHLKHHRLTLPKEKRDGNATRCRPVSSGNMTELPRQHPRTLILQKNSQDFGFTLRHFIVYPPESEV